MWGEEGQLSCTLAAKGPVQCNPGAKLLPGSGVLDSRGHLLGVLGPSLSLEALAPVLASLGLAVGSDLASRHQGGGRGLLKCRGSDSLALALVLGSHQGIQTGPGEEERMQGDDTRDVSKELTEVIGELKAEVAGSHPWTGPYHSPVRPGPPGDPAGGQGGQAAGRGEGPAEHSGPQGEWGGPAEGPATAPVSGWVVNNVNITVPSSQTTTQTLPHLRDLQVRKETLVPLA